MGKSIELDIAAIVMMSILLGARIARKMTHERANRIFLAILLTAIAAAVFDIMAVCFDNAQGTHVVVLYICNVMYLITHYLIVPLYLFFVISLADTWHKLRKNVALLVFLFLPVIVVLTALITNIGHHLIFSVENGYSRGPLLGLLYIAVLCHVIFLIYYIIKYRKLFSRKDIITIVIVVPINMTAMLIQFIEPTALVEMFCGAVGMMIISIGLQPPEEYIDTYTLLMKHSAYARNMRRAFYVDRHIYIIMINITNFQKIQSIIGYDSGIVVLRDIADKIRRINRKMHGHAELYYLDNGRFRMVFREENQDEAEAIAEVVNQELKHHINFNGLNINLAPFIILAHCPEEIKDFKALMTFGTDFHSRNYYTGQVMLAGKLYNKNQLDIQNNIDMIIERALENGSFQVYYQPIYSTRKGRFISAEALLRLFDKEHGFISPETLILAAEKSGAIHRIGAFVFEKVCQFIASEDFVNLGLDYIEVNLSVAEIMNAELPGMLLSVMEKYNISPDKINLEITESVTAHEQKVMSENIEKLTRAGLSFSLDDYGTGYSNIKRVVQLPFKIIKLDKTFVDENENPKMSIVLQNTIKMLKDMNMEVVVEGVETQEMLDIFSNLQCDFIQGYFFSKPIPRKDFVAFIAEANRRIQTGEV